MLSTRGLEVTDYASEPWMRTSRLWTEWSANGRSGEAVEGQREGETRSVRAHALCVKEEREVWWLLVTHKKTRRATSKMHIFFFKKKNVVQLWSWAGAQARIALFRIRASGRFQEEEEKKTQNEGRAKIG